MASRSTSCSPATRPARAVARAVARLGALLALAAGPSAGADGPRLVVAEPEHDFGAVQEGVALEHAFRMSAGGDEDLVIQKVQPSCGCTVAEMWRLGAGGEREPYEEGAPLSPGSRVELVTRFETRHRQGRQEKPVSIYTNSPTGVAVVRLRAHVQPVFRSEPATLDLGRFSVRDSAQGSVTVSTVDGAPVRLAVEAESPPEGLFVELEPLEPGPDGRSDRWRLEARLAAGAKEGYARHRVPLVSDREVPAGAANGDGARHLAYEVSVTAQVVGLVTATPTYMSFGLVRGGAVVSKTVRVNVYDPGMEVGAPSWTLVEGQGEGPFPFAAACDVTVRPVQGVHGWDVTLTLDGLPETFRAAFHGALVLAFDHPEVSSLRIPFTGFHRPSTRPPAPGPPPGGGR